MKNWQSRMIGRNFWRHFRSQRWKDSEFFRVSFRCSKLIKWQRLRARLTSKSRVTTANSECKSLLQTFLVSCTVAFLDLLLSSAAKLAHLSLNSILLNFVCFQIPSFIVRQCFGTGKQTSSALHAFDSIVNCSIAALEVRRYSLCVKKQKNIPLFHSEIGFTFGWVFIREGKLFIRRVRERKITQPLCFVKQNKLFFVYDLFY